MPKLSTLLSLAGTGLLATAAFVRPPVSPAPASGVPMQKVVAPKVTAKIAATTKPAPFTVAPQVSKQPLTVDIVAFAGWGTGVGELGRELPQEASPEAPMSLVVDDAGAVHVLDQVNERISIFDGKTVRVVPIPTRTAQDLALDPRGGYALLDRLVARALIFVDAYGKERSRVQVTGQGVAESGEVTALFAATDGYWVEVEHKTLVRIADKNGDPDATRPTLEGRMTKSGNFLRAARDPAGFAVVSAVGPNGFLARVPFGAGVMSLVDLASSPSGTTWIAAHVGDETSNFQIINEKLTLVAIDPTGLEIGRVDLPPPEGPEEQLRAMAISPSGAMHHLHVANVGVTIRRVK
ncbi:MAG: hypothetical protein ACXVEE_04525 [Polyangiales bacterium]